MTMTVKILMTVFLFTYFVSCNYTTKKTYYKSPSGEYKKNNIELPIKNNNLHVNSWINPKNQSTLTTTQFCSALSIITPVSVAHKIINYYIDDQIQIKRVIESESSLDIPYTNKHTLIEGTYNKLQGIISITLIKKIPCIYVVVFASENYKKEKHIFTNFINNLSL